MVEFIQRHFLPTIVSSVEGLDFHTCMKRKKKKNYACSENHKLPAKTTNSLHEIKEKYATLVPNTVKLLYRQTKKAQSERSSECRCMSDGMFIQFVCQFLNLMVVQVKVCQRFVCVVFVNSPHSSNEDHMKLDFPISLSVKVGNEHAVLCFCFLELGIGPIVSSQNLNSIR